MLLELENVSYIYDSDPAAKVEAVKDVSLKIDKGEMIGIIGHTGSGKSTLIQMFNGLIKPTMGKVLFEGEDIWGEKYSRKALRFRVGMVFQYPEYQLFEVSVIKDVCFGPKNKGLSDQECEEKAKAALKQVGIREEFFENSPLEMSGGNKRRTALAGVLAMEPDVLVLDEPAAGLDPKGKKEIYELLLKLKAERNITVVIVSHSMEDAAEYIDRLVVLDHGRKVFDGSTKEVFRHYKELEKIGLSAPQTTYILNGLKDRGFDIDTSAVTVKDTAEAIISALRRRNIC